MELAKNPTEASLQCCIIVERRRSGLDNNSRQLCCVACNTPGKNQRVTVGGFVEENIIIIKYYALVFV